MSDQGWVRQVVRWAGAAAGLAVGAYAASAAATWLGYGRERRPADPAARDEWLDRFMPDCEVAERHHVRVDAPAATALAAAQQINLSDSAIVRAVFKGREIFMGSQSAAQEAPRPLLDQMRALGWGVLAEVPGRELVLGAATRPWESNPVFRALPAGEFAAFQEPGYAKIVWTLRADPVDGERSIFRTETRVATTDAASRARFRRYWSCVKPGVVLIRRVMLSAIKSAAERRACPGQTAA